MSTQRPQPDPHTNTSSQLSLRSILAALKTPGGKRRLFAFSVSATAVLGVFACVMFLRLAGWMQPLDFLVYDALIRYRNAQGVPNWKTPVLIVQVTEADIQGVLGGQYPVSDLKMTRMLEGILEGEPSAIGVDIFRDHPSSEDVAGVSAEEQHERLGKVLQDNPNVVFIYHADLVPGVLPIQPPRALRSDEYASQRGFNNHADDLFDGAVRRALLSATKEGQPHVAFGFWLALNHLALHDIAPPAQRAPNEPLKLGKAAFPLLGPSDGDYIDANAQGEQILMDYRGPREFPSVTLSDVLQQRVPASHFKDKVVLVGVTTPSVKDFNATPLDELTYGVMTHAHVVDQLIRGALLGHQPTRPISNFAESAWILFWAVLGALAGIFARRPISFSVAAVAGILVIALVVWNSFAHGQWIPSVEPALAWFITAGIVAPSVSQRERAERAIVMELFSRTESPEVVETLLKHSDEILEGGRLKPISVTATVLFTDLKGFSFIAERMMPDDLMNWLSDYLTEMSEIVKEHRGHVDKFIGDAVMAVFGVPVPSTTPEAICDDAVRAVSSALAMRRRLSELNARWQTQGLPNVAMRIGIMSGPIVAGQISGKQKFEFTVIGDVVNTAARLESYDKELMDPDIASNDCRILIGGATCELVRGRFNTRFVARDQVHGKAQHVEIHGVIS